MAYAVVPDCLLQDEVADPIRFLACKPDSLNWNVLVAS